MIAAQKQFLTSKHLPVLLANMHRHPAAPKGGPRALGAKVALDQFSRDVMVDIFTQELEAFSNHYAEEQINLTDIDSLADLTSKTMFEKVQDLCPQLGGV